MSNLANALRGIAVVKTMLAEETIDEAQNTAEQFARPAKKIDVTQVVRNLGLDKDDLVLYDDSDNSRIPLKPKERQTKTHVPTVHQMVKAKNMVRATKGDPKLKPTRDVLKKAKLDLYKHNPLFGLFKPK